MPNLAVGYGKNHRDVYKKERVAGVIIAMSPSAGIYHSTVVKNLTLLFGNYLKGKACRVFSDNVDVHLTQDNTFIPDISIVCNPEIVKEKGIYGAPDLVAEILSRSTGKRDKTIKKDIYGKSGVKEYWIVDVHLANIEVYLLAGDKLELDKVYEFLPQAWVDEDIVTAQDKAQAITTFKTSLFDDLIIDLEEVFADINF